MSTIVFALVLTSACLHAGWNFAARKVSGNICVVWIGLCIASIISLPFAWAFSSALIWKSLPYIVTTGVINAVYFYAVARAYEIGEISEVYPIARGTGVAGAGILGHLVLLERISFPAGMGIASVCIGIWILSRRSKTSPSSASLFYPFLMGAALVSSALVDKLAMRFAEPVVYICGMLSIAALLIAPYILRYHRAECLLAWKKRKNYSVMIGLGSLISYLLILIAFQMGPLSHIIAFRETSVVIGSLLGILFLKERLTARKGIGIAVVTAGLVLVKFS